MPFAEFYSRDMKRLAVVKRTFALAFMVLTLSGCATDSKLEHGPAGTVAYNVPTDSRSVLELRHFPAPSNTALRLSNPCRSLHHPSPDNFSTPKLLTIFPSEWPVSSKCRVKNTEWRTF